MAPQALAWRALEALVCLALFALMLVVTVDVTGRYLFNKPLPAGYELVQVLMGLLAFAALPLVSRDNDHIRLGLLEHLFEGLADRVRRGFVHAFSAAVMGFMTWRLAVHAGKLAATRDATAVLQMPLAPVAWLVTLAAAAATVLLAALALRTLRRG